MTGAARRVSCVLLLWSLVFCNAWAGTACPIVIAHRGASGERPEHTIAAYRLAIEQGADFIEPDLVPTRDGVLVARHENALAVVELDAGHDIRLVDGEPVILEATTDVAAHREYRDRLTVKRIDGRHVGGWFSEDFSLAEIRTLRARERMPGVRPDNVVYNDQFEVPTFEEVLALAKEHDVGVYPELKHYTYFMIEALGHLQRPIRHDTVNLLVRELMAAGFERPDRLFVQSFEVTPLLRLRSLARQGEIPSWPLIQLTGPPQGIPYDLAASAEAGTLGALSDLFSAFGVESTALTYAELLADPAALRSSHVNGVGPAWQAVLADPGLVDRLNDAGLIVHPYTVRAEAQFLPAGQTLAELVRDLAGLGVDGFFTDHVALSRAALSHVTLDGTACR